MTDVQETARERYTTDEMMTVAASRELHDGAVCFVGIGLPSEGCEPGPRHPRPRNVCSCTSRGP